MKKIAALICSVFFVASAFPSYAINRTTVQFSGDNMTLKVDVWASRETYNSGKAPIYSESRTSAVPHF